MVSQRLPLDPASGVRRHTSKVQRPGLYPWDNLDEVVEFFSGLLPVLRFDLITAIFKNLHRRSVALVGLHEAI
jgi:hypothetical protein